MRPPAGENYLDTIYIYIYIHIYIYIFQEMAENL